MKVRILAMFLFLLSCGQEQDISVNECSGRTTDLHFNYTQLFVSDNLLTTCSVTASSGSQAFNHGEKNSPTGLCQVGLDIDDPSFGTWLFGKSPSGNLTVRYSDPPSVRDGDVYDLECN